MAEETHDCEKHIGDDPLPKPASWPPAGLVRSALSEYLMKLREARLKGGAGAKLG